MRWRMFSQTSFDRFGRLDELSKCAMVAVEMLGLPVDSPGESKRPMAILLGTRYGSVSVDMRFHQSIHRPGGASPMLFPYTLPSAAVGEIAIRFHITGPSICFVGGPQSGRTVLWEGAHLVQSGEADACVCVSCDAVTAEAAFLAEDRRGEVEGATVAAYACLIETAESATQSDRSPVADVQRIADGPAREEGAFPTAADERDMLGSLCAFLSETEAVEPPFRLDAPGAMGARRALSFRKRAQTHVATAKDDRKTHGQSDRDT